jgi:hypothetical protein
MQKLAAALLPLLFFAHITPAFAEIKATTTPVFVPSSAFIGGKSSVKPDALSSCFDHYRFGSVPAVISTTLSQAHQGGTLGFTGTVTNENTYPILDATVHIKIFHIQGLKKDVNGPDVVDFFPAVSHLTLKAKEVTPLSFTWKVPPDIEPGEYRAVTYVTSSDRFELQGLSFTDDVVGNSTNFTIAGEKLGALRFQKDSVTVADKPFYFAAFPPTVSSTTKSVPVTATVVNTTSLPLKGTITWSLYYWDALSESHLLDTKTEEMKVHPNASTTVSYTVSDTAHTVYFLKGVIKSAQGTSSIIGVRFVRPDVSEPRFNFVAIDGSTAVACIHSTAYTSAEDSDVTLTVTSDVWYASVLRLFGLGTLAHASYSGAIPGDIYALTAPIEKTAASYTIHASLSQKGKRVDMVDLSYTCTDLGTPCPSTFSKILSFLIPLIVLVSIVLAGTYFTRRKNAQNII